MLSKDKFDNKVLVTGKGNSSNSRYKNINKHIFDAMNINPKQKEQLDDYELNNI